MRITESVIMLNKYSMSLKISASLFNSMKKKIEKLD